MKRVRDNRDDTSEKRKERRLTGDENAQARLAKLNLFGSHAVAAHKGTIAAVRKKLKVGERGGMYYESDATGKRVYLTKRQRKGCEEKTLYYDVDGVCALVEHSGKKYGGFKLTKSAPEMRM